MHSVAAKPRFLDRRAVPREVLASAAGVEFLRRLGIELPASLRERVMEVVVRATRCVAYRYAIQTVRPLPACRT